MLPSSRLTKISRQEVGGSAIEVSRIAGHSKVNMTSEYTVVQLKRQDELTRKIQDLRGGSTDKKLAAVESGESIAAIEDAVTVEPAA